jgi:hypothetical protein
MTSQSYVRNAVNNVREMLQSEGYDLKTTAKTPFPSNYRPQLDILDELDADLCSRYSQLIGVLRWMIEIGRIDIYYEVSVLSHQELDILRQYITFSHICTNMTSQESSLIRPIQCVILWHSSRKIGLNSTKTSKRRCHPRCLNR